jgi:L-ascorbate metabolism protein UlaG (beta-lactamase superfamily)
LGDLKQRLTPAQLDGLGAVDVLVAPAGGRCTLEVREVVALANQMAPKIIIPVHYGYETTTEILEPLERILTELGVAEATPLPRLNVTQTNMPREMQAVVLRKSS